MTALAVLSCGVASAADIAAPQDVSIYPGRCTGKTELGIAAAGSPTFDHLPFKCDTLVLSYQKAAKTMMLQFADHASTDGRLLGFAGTLKSREVLRVKRVYLAGGAEPATANAGSCRLFWRGSKLTTAVCGAQVDAEGKRLVPRVVFDAR